MKAKPFHFKQFTVFQDCCAMKVGTDGVLLGAWTTCKQAKSILDVGSGTGVISLMLAQRANAKITALEIDSLAANQCAENFNSSDWSNRLETLPTSLQSFAKLSTDKFDLIVSNPPFFEKNKKEDSRAIARSELKLSFNELIVGATQLLAPKGVLAVIIPFSREQEFIVFSDKQKLFPSRICYVKGSKIAPVKRVLIELSFEKKERIKTEEISIEKQERHSYTEEYKGLLKDYLTIF